MKNIRVATVRAFNKPEKRKNVTNEKAAFLISVGQSEFTGDDLAAAIDLLASLKFKELLIVVAGTLQAITLQAKDPNQSKEIAYVRAKVMEEKTIQEVLSLSKKFHLNIDEKNVIGWETCIEFPGYAQHLASLEHLLSSNEVIIDACNKTASDFVIRQKKIIKTNNNGQTNLNEELLYEASKIYQKTEVPFIINVLAERGYNYIFYPHEMTPILKEVRNYFYQSTNLVQWCFYQLKDRPLEYFLQEPLQENQGVSCGREELNLQLKGLRFEQNIDIADISFKNNSPQLERKISEIYLRLLNEITYAKEISLKEKAMLTGELTEKLIQFHKIIHESESMKYKFTMFAHNEGLQNTVVLPIVTTQNQHQVKPNN